MFTVISLKDFIEKTDRDEIPDEVLREINKKNIFRMYGESLKRMDYSSK